MVRDATEADLPAILAIHNEAILNSLSIWQNEAAPLSNRQAWFAERRANGFPILAAELDGALAGYASYGPFRAGAGYDATVEHSIYVRKDLRGRGAARALMAALIDHARAGKRHVMVAAVGLPNDASLALHRGLGFREAGVLRGVGLKNGRRLDLALLQLTLG
ncbi:MAG: N-acetyltransferase family protein [Rhodoblastus sp.]|nr:MAG: N-acetyltransferase family protein [Rhodoblastus sp.]